eukprot:2862045-Ditylum_brightwellii.AAC.1
MNNVDLSSLTAAFKVVGAIDPRDDVQTMTSSEKTGVGRSLVRNAHVDQMAVARDAMCPTILINGKQVMQQHPA